jgi:hypothetical protein
MDIFQNLLNKARQGYGQIDRNVFKGVLPGGASISSSVAPMVRSVSQSPIYKTIRDKVAIPVLDRGMEAGVVPAKEGMFARFLSGTSLPITRIPADTRAAESLINNKLANPTERDKQLFEFRERMQTWTDKSQKVTAQNEMYNMYGIGSPATTQQQQEVTQLKSNLDQAAKKLNMRDPLDYYIGKEGMRSERKAAYDPLNYSMSNYSTLGTSYLELNPNQEKLVNKGLVNTLGRYQVKGGQTTGERYDFNSYNVGTPLFAPGSMVGGVIGEADSSMQLADKALSLADKFGFIRPGAGYPVQFKFR